MSDDGGFPGRRRWTRDEDARLTEAVTSLGTASWAMVASYVGTRRDWQCRERWQHHLDPSIVKGSWTREEDAFILNTVETTGRCWKWMAQQLNGRTAIACKNRYHSLSKDISVPPHLRSGACPGTCESQGPSGLQGCMPDVTTSCAITGPLASESICAHGVQLTDQGMDFAARLAQLPLPPSSSGCNERVMENSMMLGMPARPAVPLLAPPAQSYPAQTSAAQPDDSVVRRLLELHIPPHAHEHLNPANPRLRDSLAPVFDLVVRVASTPPGTAVGWSVDPRDTTGHMLITVLKYCMGLR